MTHPILEDLAWRHTVKKYDSSRKVSPEDLEVVLESLRLSPSSINSQPWKFIVIESHEAKQRMHDTFANMYQFNQPHVFESSYIVLFAYNPAYKREDYAAVVDQGIEDGRTRPEKREEAFGGFFFAELNTDESGNTSPWTKAQTYIALGNAMHTLARMRIDSTPMEGVDSELISKEFSKELDGHRCDCALAIGYRHPEEDYNAKLPKSRLKAEKVIVRL